MGWLFIVYAANLFGRSPKEREAILLLSLRGAVNRRLLALEGPHRADRHKVYQNLEAKKNASPDAFTGL